MTTLTRRRSDNEHPETWHVYFSDVHIGTIGRCAGVPLSSPQWNWDCGFYPGIEPGAQKGGAAESFDAARQAFEAAWAQLAPTLDEDAFERWRDQRDFTAWKYRMWNDKLPLPAQTQDDRSRCFCGERISTAGVHAHIRAAHRGIGA
jgi:hypothetical protein